MLGFTSRRQARFDEGEHRTSNLLRIYCRVAVGAILNALQERLAHSVFLGVFCDASPHK